MEVRFGVLGLEVACPGLQGLQPFGVYDSGFRVLGECSMMLGGHSVQS